MNKTILLHAPLHASKSEQGPAAAALVLAAWTSAKVTALLFEYNLPGRPSMDPRAAAEALEARSAELGVIVEAITSHSHAQGIHEVVADHARLHDLVVAGSDGSGLLPERQVSEYLLFESGRPLLLVPADSRKFDFRIGAVAWDGSRAAARALGDAMPLLRDADEVLLLHFPDDKPLVGSVGLPQVANSLRERGLTVRLHVAERGARPIGVALSEEALTQGAGFLVMGAFTRSPLRERLLGGATRLVLDRPALPTLLSH